MGGQVEAIVLSPAPGDEEATQDGSFQERPDQELWRQGDQGVKDLQEGQGSHVSGKDDGGKKEKKDAGGGDGEGSKAAEEKAREDGDNSAGQAELVGGKVTEGTAKDESHKKPALEDRSGNKKRKGSGGRDEKPHSVEIRIHPPNAKRISTSKRQATNIKNTNTAQKKAPSSRLKPSKMRDGEERGSKLPSPERGSRGASPEQGRNKSPGSGRASPHVVQQGSDADDKPKSNIGKTSDSEKDVEENKSKTITGGSGAGEISRDAPPTSHPRKPPVEDRALQAILAARRRSLENAGKAEPVKRKKERRLVQPEETNFSAHLTEAQRAITLGKVETALSCAQKAVDSGGDPASLVVRGRCHLLLGHLKDALEDARAALTQDPSLVKAVLVQAEALYGMGEFERSLVLFHRGARKRPDLTAFTRGIHKAREAVVNAIGGDKFPEPEEVQTATTLTDGTTGSGQSQATSVTAASTPHGPKTSKTASKRLLGGLSRDKEFLASLVNHRSLQKELTTVNTSVGSGSQVAAVAKEALTSLQHLESFMWQRDPGGAGAAAGTSGGAATKTVLQEREKKARARLKATLRRRVNAVLQKLQQEEDVEGPMREAEELLAEVRDAGIGGWLLCRLLVGVGVALPKCGRNEDAVAVLTDAVHIARANEYGEEEHVAVEALGKSLAERGQHAEAVAVWERRIPAATNSCQRASLFLLIAKSYFAMRKVETGRFYGTKSVKEADDGHDNRTALSALLALVDADARQDNMEAALKTLEKCDAHLSDAPADLLEEYSTIKGKLSHCKEETSS
ncbi:outer dynein arm-docking complex subunit 4-like isoform X2 [Portunus trituberculatus]|uniref:outer dynein arm-docking complex subunit 4-like isoform X2 n=1 Tax=Portunus trituberculatus TaxID=210409 RepID=UPI001E1CDAC4|nr:outer dynein arm-docking complex subunit 4-like isoform X2 [Portunus trituberculatus]